jgi:hypothetical protein
MLVVKIFSQLLIQGTRSGWLKVRDAFSPLKHQFSHSCSFSPSVAAMILTLLKRREGTQIACNSELDTRNAFASATGHKNLNRANKNVSNG